MLRELSTWPFLRTECRAKSQYKDRQKSGTVQIFGTSLTNQNSIQEEIKSRQIMEYLLSFGAEFFVFQFAMQKYED
jgi:hypothetical protein